MSDSKSPFILWAAHKATLRGKLIQIAPHRIDIGHLEGELCFLYAAHKWKPDCAMLFHIEANRLSLNLLLSTRAKKSLSWSSAKFYMQKDRIGYMLSAKLSPRIRQSAILKIRCSNGKYTLDPYKALQEFHRFSNKLYQATFLAENL